MNRFSDFSVRRNYKCKNEAGGSDDLAVNIDINSPQPIVANADNKGTFDKSSNENIDILLSEGKALNGTIDMSDVSFESLGDGYSVAISGEHRFGTDAFLLADFASPRRKDTVCDLCSGGGIVALLALRNFAPARVYAVELQEKAYRLLELSKSASGALGGSESGRLIPIHTDLRLWRCPEAVDVITCNPPYKAVGSGAPSGSPAEAIARQEFECSVYDVCEAAKRSLKYGGRLVICQRPERLSDCIEAMRSNSIEPKRLRSVHKDADTSAWLILLEGRMGGARGFMTIEPPLIVKGADGEEYSREMKRIYRLQ